ncbi:MAG: hypothetical protein MUO26_10140 [Methanotrichaceae archaeon]|nr:hypothetical protein [Methanotrichaceae archaeon]
MIIRFLIGAFVLCSMALSSAQMQSVGEDFGKTWIEKYGNKPVPAEEKNDLWSWGGIPRGYQIINGQLNPILAPTEIYYPMFMTNATPLYLNGTAWMKNRNYLPPNFATSDFLAPDFMSPDLIADPWFLAQELGRPVVIVYPSNTRGANLL